MNLFILRKEAYLKVIMVIVTLYHTSFTVDAELNPLNREIRFTKFDVTIPQLFVGEILESTIKNCGTKQLLFVHAKANTIITDFNIQYSVFKCKEYYIDCVNVVSFDIFNMCSKLELLLSFNNIRSTENTLKKCPIYGEYKYSNLSIDANKFMSSFSNPTEKWWEHYWKLYFVTKNDKLGIISKGTMAFYFIQYRKRNRQLNSRSN